MPTFHDPILDSAEASAALRGLAHATRDLPHPGETYPLIGELLSGVRSLRQVIDQLAATHIRYRAVAHDDAGDQTAGATSALAAADELHHAGTLLDAMHERLGTAMLHSGRIAWHEVPPNPYAGQESAVRSTVQVGSLLLTVWPDIPLGEHQRYAYRIEHAETGQMVEGRDLFTGTGAPVSPARALRELAVFLSAAGQSRQFAIDNPGQHTDNDGAFPEWLEDAARQHQDELAVLIDRDPDLADPVEKTPGRWVSIVFLQGDEADTVLDLIARDGADAAIDHLAGYDFGEETTQAALENGYVYDQPPAGALDRMAAKGEYILAYSPFLSHVSLLRAHDTAPDPALLPAAPVAARPAGRGAGWASAQTASGKGTDWFAHRAGAAASQGRGRAL